MTHILVNIEYNDLLPILNDEKKGKRMIEEWTTYNNHTLVKSPDMVVFPSTYIEKKDKSKDWDVNSFSNFGLYDNFSFLNSQNNDVVRQYNYHGYTGVGILKESHISIHTYPEQKCMHIDFFSCKILNKKHNTIFIEKYFEKSKAKQFKIQFINRNL